MSAGRGRSWLSRLLRLGVSALLIAYVLSRAELDRVGEVLRAASLTLIGIAFLSYFVGFMASVARWRALLAAHGVRPSFGYLYCSFMVGMFFNQLLPTTVGGDVARYHYTAAAGRGAALSAVLLDRVFGAVSLMLFAVVGLLVAGRQGVLPPVLLQAVAIMLALGFLALSAAFLLPPSSRSSLARLWRFLPRALVSLLEKLLGSFSVFGGRHDVLLVALLWSLLLQCVVVAHYYLVGYAIGLDVPFYAYVFIVPVAIVVMMLPISINGIGVREGVFAYLLGLYGVELSESLAFAWIIYALVLAQGLLGGLVFALLRAQRAGPPAENEGPR